MGVCVKESRGRKREKEKRWRVENSPGARVGLTTFQTRPAMSTNYYSFELA